VVDEQRQTDVPPEAIHELTVYRSFSNNEGQLFIPLGCVRHFKIADRALADSLRAAYRLPDGLIEDDMSAQGHWYSSSKAESDALADEEALSHFRIWRRALLYAFVWTCKHRPVDAPAAESFAEALLSGLEAHHLQSLPLLVPLMEAIIACGEPPRQRIPNAKIQDSTAAVDQWFWFGRFLKKRVFEGQKMPPEARQWYMQFKSRPYDIQTPVLPEALQSVHIAVWSWLLFLQLCDAPDPEVSRKVFAQHFAPVTSQVLSADALERVFLYASMFQGVSVDTADSYFMVPAAQDVMAFLEYQALLLHEPFGLARDEEKYADMRQKAIKALSRVLAPDNMEAHVYAYYAFQNPHIAQAEVVRWQPVQEVPEGAADHGVQQEVAPQKESCVLVLSAEDVATFSSNNTGYLIGLRSECAPCCFVIQR